MSSEDKRFLFGGGFNLGAALQQVMNIVKNVCANAPPGMKEIYKLNARISKNSLTLNEWKFNLSFSRVSLLFLNSWRASVIPYYMTTHPPAIQKQH